ncbi:MAG: RNA polymerase sigma factor [Bacteroidaceae bacterium]|nr:RNA polymerase sigma factor [Bacteroidaceae bacterium]
MTAEIFKDQFIPYHQKLYCLAFRLMGNQAEAEDMVQETYLKLWSKREELVDIRNTEAFSISVLKNLCFDQLRSGKASILRQATELTGLQNSAKERDWEKEDEANLAKRLIEKLPEKQRVIMTLRDVKDLSFEEIEQVTGLRSVNIRVLLSKARKQVREQFKRWQ